MNREQKERFGLEILLKQDFYGLKDFQVRRAVDGYLLAVETILKRHLRKAKSLHGIITISLKEARDDGGSFKYGGVRYYNWYELQRLSKMFQIHETGSGFSQKLSTAMLNPKYLPIWEDLLVNKETTTEIAKDVADEALAKQKINAENLLETPVMVNRLKKAIELARQRQEILDGYHKLYGNKQNIYKNAPEADRIDYFATAKRCWSKDEVVTAEAILQMVAEYNKPFIYRDHTYLFPQQLERAANSARLYCKGNVNLQNCSRNVRYAAIGKGYQYDLSTSAFSLLYGMYVALGNDRLPCVEEFINNKVEIRERVCKEVYGTTYDTQMQKIKYAFSAIGFGANTENYTTALDDLFYKDEKVAFLEHPFIVCFMTQWDLVKDAVFEVAKQAKANNQPIYEDVPFPKPFNKAKACAYVYQCLERMAFDSAMRYCAAYDKHVILYLHDGFITTTRIDVSDLNLYLQNELGEFAEFLHFSEEKIDWDDALPTPSQKEHRKSISAEEKLAADYAARYTVEYDSDVLNNLAQRNLLEEWLENSA